MRRRETGQRNLIYNAAKSLYHPTAEEVYAKVKAEDKGVGRATVFRNLSVLSEEGKFVRLFFADHATRYDTNPAPHDHFVCKRCGRIIDIPASCGLKMPENLNVENASITFYGLCDDCKNNEQRENDIPDKN